MFAGITKVRNEEEIIQDTLDHFLQFCDKIYVYDDASTDRTAEICGAHKNVIVIEGKEWNPNRLEAEYLTRQKVLERAQQDSPDWFIAFDADERIEFDFDLNHCDAVRMKLFDFYITEEDKDLTYKERKWLGPEYREIIMIFKNHPNLRYSIPDQREITLPLGFKIKEAGYVKHYGKAISVKQWEDTCDYYSKYFPEPYKTKWQNRKGKAIHTKSDFGRDLILWKDKDIRGIKI